MNKENTIGNLIEKFRNGSASQEELSVLLSYFKGNEPQGELADFYQQVWERVSSENADADPEKLFPGLLTKIDPDKRDIQQIPVPFMRNMWKYAALFVLAFSISWLVNNLIHDRNIKSGITYQNIVVPYGSRSKVELPDGSSVILNAGSSLRYANGFGNNSRTVSLQGEAYFDVIKENGKPFYVIASGMKIKVTGTTFNVQAYPEEENIATTLVSGSVQIFQAESKEEKTPLAALKPGQKALYRKGGNHEIRVTDVTKPELAIAWKDDQFVFDNESFKDLAIRIKRWYNVEVILNYPELKEARFSGRFDKETIEQAMKALTLVTPFHFSIEKNRITINK